MERADYYKQQFEPFIAEGRDVFVPTIKIFSGKNTDLVSKHMSVTADQLERILAIMQEGPTERGTIYGDKPFRVNTRDTFKLAVGEDTAIELAQSEYAAWESDRKPEDPFYPYNVFDNANYGVITISNTVEHINLIAECISDALDSYSKQEEPDYKPHIARNMRESLAELLEHLAEATARESRGK